MNTHLRDSNSTAPEGPSASHMIVVLAIVGVISFWAVIAVLVVRWASS
jgi:hypothetical protein